MVCRDPTPSEILSDSDTDLTFPFADDSIEEEQDADCVFCTGRFSEDHNVEEWTRCAKYFRWAHALYLGMEEILFVSLVRDKNCFILPFYL